MAEPIIRITDLEIRIDSDDQIILNGVSLDVEQGDVYCIVGESGSGKTTLALSLLAYCRAGSHFSAGQVFLNGSDLLAMSEGQIRSVRGDRVAYIPQDPGTALNPAMSIGEQLTEHLAKGKSHKTQVDQVLLDVGLPNDDLFLRRKPSELSGGQQQRVAIAIAIVGDPDVLVLDEPTTGLDMQSQEMVLDLVAKICRARQLTAIYVTHDMGVVAKVASHVAVMYDGDIVETGSRDQVLYDPQHAYTKMLLSSVLDIDDTSVSRGLTDIGSRETLALEVRDIEASYGEKQVLFGISLEVPRGTCTALVGESGSGKSTLSRLLIGLHQESFTGEILLDGAVLRHPAKLRSRDDWRRMQYVFQNPYGSLNPRETIRRSLVRARRASFRESRRTAQAAVDHQIERVEFSASLLDRYPSELSGGQRQRVAIARALLAEPDVLLCDEITSALDVSVQAAIIDLLRGLLDDGLSMLFVTHDLGVVRALADQAVVMQYGRVVEHGETEQIFTKPQSSYTQLLIDLAPRFHPVSHAPQ